MVTLVKMVVPSDFDDSIVLGQNTPNKFGVNLSALNLPANTGVKTFTLENKTLTIVTQSGSNPTVDLTPLFPAIVAEVFLKKVERVGNKIKFTVGEAGNTNSDNVLEIDVADLLPVTTDGATVLGDGTATNPLKVQISTATQNNLLKLGADGLYVSQDDLPTIQVAARTIRLVNASGETEIGYIYSTEQ